MTKQWRNQKAKSIDSKSRVALSNSTEPTPLPAGRVSLDSYNQRTPLGDGWVMVAPSDHESFWRLSNLDTNHLDWFTPQELLYMLIDLSPEVSAAHWHFNRMCNPGYEIKAYNVGSTDVENIPAKQHCDSVIALLKERYGSADVVINRFFTGAFLVVESVQSLCWMGKPGRPSTGYPQTLTAYVSELNLIPCASKFGKQGSGKAEISFPSMCQPSSTSPLTPYQPPLMADLLPALHSSPLSLA